MVFIPPAEPRKQGAKSSSSRAVRGTVVTIMEARNIRSHSSPASLNVVRCPYTQLTAVSRLSMSPSGDQAGYYFGLALLIARCTRGESGVPFVIMFTASHWEMFVNDFPCFCKTLVIASRDICQKKGSTYLAHHDGLAAGLSGLQFLATLLVKQCREALQTVAAANAAIFGRLIAGKGRSVLTAAEFLSIGEALIGGVCLAIHKGGKQRWMRRYNVMDTSRCIECALRHALGTRPLEYTEEVHAWLLKMQTKKFRMQQLEDLYYFGVRSHKDMAKSIRKLMTICTGTVTFTTVFVHFCEVRQCINKYTLGGVAFLIELYKTRRDCKAAADECRANMTCGQWKQCYACAAVMVLDQIKNAAGMSVVDVTQKGLRSSTCMQVLDAMAKKMLSPKCVLEGIPEWEALRSNLCTITERCQQQGRSTAPFGDLEKAAKTLNVHTHTAAGDRKNAKKLKKEINFRLKEVAKCPSAKPRTRPYSVVEAEMKARQLNPTPYVDGKRRRLSVAEMEVLLEMKGCRSAC